jgi:hypothetical protein
VTSVVGPAAEFPLSVTALRMSASPTQCGLDEQAVHCHVDRDVVPSDSGALSRRNRLTEGHDPVDDRQQRETASNGVEMFSSTVMSSARSVEFPEPDEADRVGAPFRAT